MMGRLNEANQTGITVFSVVQGTISYFEFTSISRPGADNEVREPVLRVLYDSQPFLG